MMSGRDLTRITTARTALPTALLLALLSGCSFTDQATDRSAIIEPVLPQGASSCPQPQAASFDQVLCPMNYQPVCGIHGDNKSLSNYGNACSACADPTVVGYTEGRCP